MMSTNSKIFIILAILTIIIVFPRDINCNFMQPSSGSAATTSIKLPSLYWSKDNKQFNDPKSLDINYYLKLNAHIGDSIDLVCPKRSSSVNTNTSNTDSFSIIYKVSSKHEFDNCIINANNTETVQILKCDKPNAFNSIKFTIYFVKFSPVPNALEFEEDKEYYFLSTSSGTRDGLNYMSGGLCSKFNMRFSIKINSQSSPNQASASNQQPVAQNSQQLSNQLLRKNINTTSLLISKLYSAGSAASLSSYSMDKSHENDDLESDDLDNLDDDEDDELQAKSQPSNLNLVVSSSNTINKRLSIFMSISLLLFLFVLKSINFS